MILKYFEGKRKKKKLTDQSIYRMYILYLNLDRKKKMKKK